MSKRLVPIGSVILAIILIVVIVAVAASRKSQTTPAPQNQTSTPATTESKASSGSLKSLLSGGKNQTCQVSYTASDQKVAGTVYVAGGNKMRGDFTLTDSQNKETVSHMIVDSQVGYFWSSASTQGMKMKIEEVSPSPAASTATQGADLNRDVEYKCSDWAVDNSKFSPPSDIQFTDLTQTVTNLQNQATTVKPDLKSICNQITDPQAKAACLSAQQ
jgi:hypothetical protein